MFHSPSGVSMEINFFYVCMTFLSLFLAEDIKSVPLHGMETYAAGGTIILCVFSLFNNFIILQVSLSYRRYRMVKMQFQVDVEVT